MRIWRGAARVVLALAALVGLVGGVPLVLLRATTWPITGLPTSDQLRDLPTTVATDEAILGVLTVGLWVCWAVFTISVVVELVAQLRGPARPQLRLGGPLQRMAGYLVGSLMISVGSVGPAAMPAVGAAAAAVDSPVPLPDPAEAPVVVDLLDVELDRGSPAPAATGAATVTVQRGDSPWSLAQAHLGDGMRWREIWELNRIREQADGASWADPRAAIRPGWELALPGGAADATPPTPAAPPAPPELLPEVEVQPGDNFWRMAEAELAAAWGRAPSDHEVANYWRTFVDDNRERLLPPDDPNLIYPGQSFAVPATPVPPDDAALDLPQQPAPPSTAPAPDAPSADPPAASIPTTTTTIPAGQAGTGATPTTAVPTTQPAPGATTPTTTPPTSEVTETTEPQSSATTTPATETGGALPTTPPEPTSNGLDASDEEAGSWVPVSLIAGGMALAGAVLLLDRRRRAQLRHRAPGRRIAAPPPPLPTSERALRGTAQPDTAYLVDAALRAAAAASRSTGLPPLRWVEATPEQVLVVLEVPAPPPAGFVAVAPDRWVTVTDYQTLATQGTRVVAPAPTLVPVGTTAAGTELLVELESSGVVSLDGPSGPLVELLHAIALAAATAPWGEGNRVVVAGLPGAFSELTPVTPVEAFGPALAEAQAHAVQAQAELRALRCATTSQARAAGSFPESCLPLLLLSGVRPDPAEVPTLAQLVTHSGHGVAVVIPATGAPGDPPLGRRFVIGPDGLLRIEGVDEPVQPRGLTTDDVDTVMALLEVASRLDDVPSAGSGEPDGVRRPPAPAMRPSPPPPEETAPVSPSGANASPVPDTDPEAAAAQGPEVAGALPPTVPGHLDLLLGEVDVLVRVLGEVEAVRLHGPDGEQRLVPTRQKGLEAIAYLALRESAVDREDLEINLFPAGANAAKTVYNTISAARLLVGDELLPPPDAGRYELSERVVTDYGLFCELVAQAGEVGGDQVAVRLLTDALGLVQGEPFTGVGRGYAWVGPHRGMIVAQVIDAAEKLAELQLAAGDWRGAEWAARQGLRTFPSDERMYRLLMRTAHAAGNIPGVQRVFRELCDVIADPDDGVEPVDTLHDETVRLLEELTRRPEPAGNASGSARL